MRVGLRKASTLLQAIRDVVKKRPASAPAAQAAGGSAAAEGQKEEKGVVLLLLSPLPRTRRQVGREYQLLQWRGVAGPSSRSRP